MPFRHMKMPTHSLRLRMTITVAIAVLLCFVMLSSVSIRAMNSIMRARLQTSVLSDVRQISNQMRQEYLSLIYVSQQMISEGSIGIHMERYLSSANQYYRIVNSKLISESLNLATFSIPKIQMVMYYTDNNGIPKPVLANAMHKETFDPNSLDVLSKTAYIQFHSGHLAFSRVTNADVISLVRSTFFSDGVERFIYVEARSDLSKDLAEISELQRMHYSLIQVDMDGMVRHSSLEEFPKGSVFGFESSSPESPDSGQSKGYVWGRSEEIFGFVNVLLVPAAEYDREKNEWQKEIAISVFAAVLLVFFISVSFHSEFYRPIKLLAQEMARFGKGDMQIREFRLSIKEYAYLFSQFNRLKSEIAELLADITRTEQEKSRLELDKLYYQINPHFLMNALSSAHWQAVMENKEEIAAYLSRLNYMLGYTLGKVKINTTIRTELQVMETYLELQRTRHDFQVHMDVEEGLYLERSCARLILQPVVENAVCHNLDDFGNLWITVRDLGSAVKIIISDDGAGFDPQTQTFKEPPEKGGEREISRGIGLRYVWLSLIDFYYGEASMEIDSEPRKGTTVTMILPYHDKSASEAL